MNKDTYINYNLKNGCIIRWPEQCFPLPVFIAPCTFYSMSNADKYAYTNMIKTHKFQPEVVQAMEVIEPEEKIKMLGKLPDDLLAIVITQIDAKVFADQIIKQHPQLLAKAIMT